MRNAPSAKSAYAFVLKFFFTCGAIVWLGCAGSSHDADARYQELAVKVGNWIAAQRVETPDGAAWPVDALRPETVGTNLSTGVAGKTAFFLMLHDARPSPESLAQIRLGADYLLATLPDSLGLNAFPPASGLYGGIAGIGFVLREAWLATQDARYRDGFHRCLALLHRDIKRTENGVLWSETFNDLYFGNSGTGLFLLYAASAGADSAAASLAAEAGQMLLQRAISEQGGLNWKYRQDREFILPNFSHGASGNAFFLAGLHQETDEDEFLDAALAAARYLESVAREEDGALFVPYGWPLERWEGQYDLGWAHGVAGTSRLFYRLWRATGEEKWLNFVHAAAGALMATGLPDTVQSRFGDAEMPDDMRFGTAGIAVFMIDLFHLTKDREYLDFARRLTDSILAKATEDDTSLYWQTKRPDFMEHGGEDARFTGYLQGAAGYGVLLLKLAAAESGRPPGLRFPDDVRLP